MSSSVQFRDFCIPVHIRNPIGKLFQKGSVVRTKQYFVTFSFDFSQKQWIDRIFLGFLRASLDPLWEIDKCLYSTLFFCLLLVTTFEDDKK